MSPIQAAKTAINPSYYTRFAIQPIAFIRKNGLSFLQGNVIKYVCRADAKNGVEDLRKARTYLDMMIEEAEEKAKASKDVADKKLYAKAMAELKRSPYRTFRATTPLV